VAGLATAADTGGQGFQFIQRHHAQQQPVADFFKLVEDFLAMADNALAGLAVAPAALSGAAHAQRGAAPITVVVPYTAGSAPDLFARLLVEHMRQLSGQTIIVENRVGASGNLGTLSVARAAPDGTTLLVTANTIVMNPSLFKSLQYDPVKSFEPVAAPRPAAAAGDRLRHAVERSGLFYESHVAQWAGGAREEAELRAEALRLAAGAESSAQRMAAQVALLQDGVLRIEGPAWPGQPMRLAIAREDGAPADDGVAAAEPVFTAQLALELPQLGPIEVVLRLAGAAVSADLRAHRPDALAQALPELADRFAACGLRPVALRSGAEIVEG